MIDVTVQAAPFSAEFEQQLSELSRVVFTQRYPDDLDWRLARMPDATVTVARAGDALVGFKVGYAVTKTRYYSWLGGVHPDFRRQGIAAKLMDAQHTWVREAGYSAVETATTPENRTMLALNLRHGFTVIGNYTRDGMRVLLAKKVA
jgi:GNAT superfamily N-acetyltransferase